MNPSDKKKTAVITGASGITGRHCLERLCSSSDWRIITFSRRPLDLDCALDNVHQLHVDLQDKNKVESALKEKVPDAFWGQGTHETPKNGGAGVYIFHCAYTTTGDSFKDCKVNLDMLRNTVDAVESIPGASVAHVFTMQGTKYYGQQFSTPLKTPFDERDPRHIGPNFYFDLEDYLRERVQGGVPWTWSALRPNPVCGFSSGSFMNLTVSIAVYASICKELGLDLRFPGSHTAYTELMEVCDAGLLADAMVFTATNPAAANEAFNINNGDLFRWEQVWSSIAEWFGLQLAPPMKVGLPAVMKGHKKTWERMVERYNIIAVPYEKLATWEFADFVFNMPSGGWFSNTTKLRKVGFEGMVLDTREMFVRQFQMLREKKVIP